MCFPGGSSTLPLIDPFDSTRLGSYYYNLSVEKVVVPGKTPALLSIPREGAPFCIKPGRIEWLRMAERITTPKNVIASLEQTHHFTRMGLTFINLSLVFPNYSGYLTCAVANFSSSEIPIFKHETIARLTFFELRESTYAPQKSKSYTTKEQYDADLIKEARDGDDTFFGLSEIESKIQSSVMGDMEKFASKVLWRYGLAGAALIVFFTNLPVLQGIFTKTVYGDNIVTKAELRDAIEIMRTMQSLREEDDTGAKSED